MSAINETSRLAAAMCRFAEGNSPNYDSDAAARKLHEDLESGDLVIIPAAYFRALEAVAEASKTAASPNDEGYVSIGPLEEALARLDAAGVHT